MGAAAILAHGAFPGAPFSGVPGMPGVPAPVATFVGFTALASVLPSFLVGGSVIQSEKRSGSFAIFRFTPIRPTELVVARVLACFLSSVAAILLFRLVLELSFYISPREGEVYWEIARGFHPLCFVIAVAYCWSALGTGLWLSLAPEVVPFVVALASALILLMPFVVSVVVLGMDSVAVFISLAEHSMGRADLITGLFALGTIVLWIACITFSRKRVYV
jgi:hypothetical protein